MSHSPALTSVEEHYSPPAVASRIAAVFDDQWRAGDIIATSKIAALDQFHTGGLSATEKLANALNPGPNDLILDVGAGLGGPARYLAEHYGCTVQGIDLSKEFVDAARYLSARTGLTDKTHFEVGVAPILNFANATFDAAILQHVAMNVKDRARLYGELHRVLKTGGKFVTHDVTWGRGDPIFPMPWASVADDSYLLDLEQTCKEIERAGFEAIEIRDETETGLDWFAKVFAAGPAPLGLGLVMGQGFRAAGENLFRSLKGGQVKILMATFQSR